MRFQFWSSRDKTEKEPMKKLIASLASCRDLALGLWASLPHQVQAGFILFGTVVITTLSKEFQALIFGTAHFTRSSLQHDLGFAIAAGFVAVRTFYMVPSPPSDKADALAEQAAEQAPAQP
jgi:hypothetical protein